MKRVRFRFLKRLAQWALTSLLIALIAAPLIAFIWLMNHHPRWIWGSIATITILGFMHNFISTETGHLLRRIVVGGAKGMGFGALAICAFLAAVYVSGPGDLEDPVIHVNGRSW